MNAEEAKDIPESVFADDDGSADARLAQSLIRHRRGKAPLADVVDALSYARVLVPIIASGDMRHVGEHGLEQDAVASTGVVAVELADGRRALPVFTDTDALAAWKPEARPVPVEGPRAALAAVAEQWSALVVNPAMEATIIPRPALWALAQGNPWQPAVIDGVVADDVRDALISAAMAEESIRDAACESGADAEVTVVLSVTEGLTAAELHAVVARVQERLGESPVVAERVDSLQLRVQN